MNFYVRMCLIFLVGLSSGFICFVFVLYFALQKGTKHFHKNAHKRQFPATTKPESKQYAGPHAFASPAVVSKRASAARPAFSSSRSVDLQTVRKSSSKKSIERHAIVREGWLLIKGTRGWHKRYCVLRYYGLAFYRTEQKDVCVGMVKLNQCACTLLEQNKKGFVFEICHPQGHRIYSGTGPNDETIEEPCLSNVLSQIIFKTKSIDEMEGWTSDCLEIISELGNESSGITGEYNIVEEAKEGTEQISDGEESEEEEEEEGDDADIEEQQAEEKMLEEIKAAMERSEAALDDDDTEEDDLDSSREGILYFQPSSNQWVKRFFILNKRELFVHKAASSATVSDDNLLAVVSLVGCDIRSLKDEEKRDKMMSKQQRKCAFEIIHREKARIFETETPSGRALSAIVTYPHLLLLRANSLSEANDWITALRVATGALKIPPLDQAFPTLPEVPYEQANWLNLLLRRHFHDMVDSEILEHQILRMFKKSLAAVKLPHFLGDVSVDRVIFGRDMMQVRGLKMLPVKSREHEIIGRIKVEYHGGMGAQASTEMYVNWPSSKSMTIPVVAKVTLERLVGELLFHGGEALGNRFLVCFMEPPDAQFNALLQVGEKKIKLTGLRVLKKFILTTLRKLLRTKTVYPNRLTFNIPYPGKKLDLKPESFHHKSVPAPFTPHEYISSEVVSKEFVLETFIHKILNRGDLSKLEKYFHYNVILHGSNPIEEDYKGYDGVERLLTDFRNAIPDVRFAIEDFNVEGSNVHAHIKAKGFHSGPLWRQPATDKEILLNMYFIMKVTYYKIYEVWIYFDPPSVFALLP